MCCGDFVGTSTVTLAGCLGESFLMSLVSTDLSYMRGELCCCIDVLVSSVLLSMLWLGADVAPLLG